MSFTDNERAGISDLLLQEPNISVLMQLAKSVTKNLIEISTHTEALEIIFMHSIDAYSLLNKRAVTKEILFKYLHKNRVAVTSDFTKSILINKAIEFWQEKGSDSSTVNCPAPEHTPHLTIGKRLAEISGDDAQQKTEQYPIHLLARKFSEWFFENYNAGNLKLEDFWPDAKIMLQIFANDRSDDQEASRAVDAIEILERCKSQFGFFFNPNLTHAGVQGRMDVHGLVVVLVCGTLHTQHTCVGVFECTHGLMRDPFAKNNWKIKTIQCTLRSQCAPTVPSLTTSDTLRDSLLLPEPSGELS